MPQPACLLHVKSLQQPPHATASCLCRLCLATEGWPPLHPQCTTPYLHPSHHCCSIPPLRHPSSQHTCACPQPVFQRCLASGTLSQADVAAMAEAFIARLPELVYENPKAPRLVAHCLGVLMAPATAPLADMAEALCYAGAWRACALLLCIGTWR
jgi:hypothetical protein